MDLMLFACPVRQEDNPTTITLATRPCVYSHNYLQVEHLNTQGVVAPPSDIAVCVRPINHTRQLYVTPELLAQYVEYWRIMGAENVHLYVSSVSQPLDKLLGVYKQERVKFVDVTDWEVVERETELAVSDEAAVNHCLFKHMMDHRYIIITSMDDALMFGPRYFNVKQLLRDPAFQEQLDTDYGYRVSGLSRRRGPTRHTMLVAPDALLASSANHFIPLSGQPSFKVLAPSYATTVPLPQLLQHWSLKQHHDSIASAANKRLVAVAL